jgi:fibro-slime domain-containing protein
MIMAAMAACSSSSDGGAGNDAGASSSGSGSGGGSSGGSSSGGSGSSSGGTLGPVPDSGPGSTEPSALTAIIRDFKLYNAGDSTTNPDFENVPTNSGTGPWDDKNAVTTSLGADGKPAFAGTGPTVTIHGPTSFAQWYNDVPGTNIHVEYPIPLTQNADGTRGYDSQVSGVPLSASDPTKMFFPIDDGTKYATAFGNQGDPHNYSFTVEMHAKFTYRGGESFSFRGDDDVWVYIDGKRVIDLGGIHGPEQANVQVDTLGLTKGTEYPLDFFSAERHKVGSNILFETSLDLRPAPPK